MKAGRAGIRLQSHHEAGGGALLFRLDQVLHNATGLAVTVAENPLHCVALGTGRALEERKRLGNVLTPTY